jgi:pyridinium-3,5-biscarboxylic acid mononucleotide synthase
MLDAQSIEKLLSRVARGEVDVPAALAALKKLPFEDLGFARVDHHRHLRRGLGEAIYCAGKTPSQVAEIALKMSEASGRLLGTRATQEHYRAAKALVPDLQYQETARALWLDRNPRRTRRPGVAVVAAGTSDMPVAEEAALTADLAGHEVRRLYDVGVAGVHRLLGELTTLQSARVIIVVAGMEGALASVVAGLVAAPVIAVPTSVGYGVSAGGWAALLGMLSSCAPGMAVVNNDNGYGAGCMAAMINSIAETGDGSARQPVETKKKNGRERTQRSQKKRGHE